MPIVAFSNRELCESLARCMLEDYEIEGDGAPATPDGLMSDSIWIP